MVASCRGCCRRVGTGRVGPGRWFACEHKPGPETWVRSESLNGATPGCVIVRVRFLLLPLSLVSHSKVMHFFFLKTVSDILFVIEKNIYIQTPELYRKRHGVPGPGQDPASGVVTAVSPSTGLPMSRVL